MVTYVITVLDVDHLEVITEADMNEYAIQLADDVMKGIEMVLDERSRDKADVS
jgi:hypothetical protein